MIDINGLNIQKHPLHERFDVHEVHSIVIREGDSGGANPHFIIDMYPEWKMRDGYGAIFGFFPTGTQYIYKKDYAVGGKTVGYHHFIREFEDATGLSFSGIKHGTHTSPLMRKSPEAYCDFEHSVKENVYAVFESYSQGQDRDGFHRQFRMWVSGDSS